MTLGQLCNKLLHDLLVGERLSKGTHIFEVSWRKSRHLREVAPKIYGEPIDDAATPPLGVLACQDLAADAPVEQNEFSVNSNSCLEARCSDSLLKLGKESGVTVAVIGRGGCSHA